MNLTELELSWAAGLFEGEGTVAIYGGGRRPYTRLKVMVTNTDFEIISFFEDRWNGNVYERAALKAGKNARATKTWTLGSKRAEDFLRDIAPFIRTARVRAKIDLAFESQAARRRGNRRNVEEYRLTNQAFRMRMAKLNERGFKPSEREYDRRRRLYGIQMPNGQTMGEAALPQIEQAYKDGKMPKQIAGW